LVRATVSLDDLAAVERQVEGPTDSDVSKRTAARVELQEVGLRDVVDVQLPGVAVSDLGRQLLGHACERPVGAARTDGTHLRSPILAEAPDDLVWVAGRLRRVRPLAEVRVAHEADLAAAGTGDSVRAGPRDRA
jgi:hypothetical protein